MRKSNNKASRRVYSEWYSRLSPEWRDECELLYNGDEVEVQQPPDEKVDG